MTYSIITFYNLNLNPLKYYIRHRGRYLYISDRPYQQKNLTIRKICNIKVEIW